VPIEGAKNTLKQYTSWDQATVYLWYPAVVAN